MTASVAVAAQRRRRRPPLPAARFAVVVAFFSLILVDNDGGHRRHHAAESYVLRPHLSNRQRPLMPWSSAASGQHTDKKIAFGGSTTACYGREQGISPPQAVVRGTGENDGGRAKKAYGEISELQGRLRLRRFLGHSSSLLLSTLNKWVRKAVAVFALVLVLTTAAVVAPTPRYQQAHAATTTTLATTSAAAFRQSGSTISSSSKSVEKALRKKLDELVYGGDVDAVTSNERVRQALEEQDRKIELQRRRELDDERRRAQSIEDREGKPARRWYERQCAQRRRKLRDEKRDGLAELKLNLLRQGIDWNLDLEGQRELVFYEKGIDLGDVPGTPYYFERRLEKLAFRQSLAFEKKYNRQIVACIVQDIENRGVIVDPVRYLQSHPIATKQIWDLPQHEAKRLAEQYTNNLRKYGQIASVKISILNVLESTGLYRKLNSIVNKRHQQQQQATVINWDNDDLSSKLEAIMLLLKEKGRRLLSQIEEQRRRYGVGTSSPTLSVSSWTGAGTKKPQKSPSLLPTPLAAVASLVAVTGAGYWFYTYYKRKEEISDWDYDEDYMDSDKSGWKEEALMNELSRIFGVIRDPSSRMIRDSSGEADKNESSDSRADDADRDSSEPAKRNLLDVTMSVPKWKVFGDTTPTSDDDTDEAEDIPKEDLSSDTTVVFTPADACSAIKKVTWQTTSATYEPPTADITTSTTTESDGNPPSFGQTLSGVNEATVASSSEAPSVKAFTPTESDANPPSFEQKPDKRNEATAASSSETPSVKVFNPNAQSSGSLSVSPSADTAAATPTSSDNFPGKSSDGNPPSFGQAPSSKRDAPASAFEKAPTAYASTSSGGTDMPNVAKEPDGNPPSFDQYLSPSNAVDAVHVSAANTADAGPTDTGRPDSKETVVVADQDQSKPNRWSVEPLVRMFKKAPEFTTLLAKLLASAAPNRFPDIELLPGGDELSTMKEFDSSKAEQLLADARRSEAIDEEEAIAIYEDVSQDMLNDIVEGETSSMDETGTDSPTEVSVDTVVGFMERISSVYDALLIGFTHSPHSGGGGGGGD